MGNNSYIRKAIAFSAAMSMGYLFWCSNLAKADDDWFVSVYGGRFSNTVLIENLRFKYDFENSYVYVLSAGKEIGNWNRWLSFEIEGQVGQHQGMQSHQEINAAFTIRWLPFFWDHLIDTSFAFGNGASYATRDPAIEVQKDENNRTAQWLYYILLEWAFALPDQPQWDLFLRIHHRSGIYGRIAGDDAVTNFVGLGLRYTFLSR